MSLDSGVMSTWRSLYVLQYSIWTVSCIFMSPPSAVSSPKHLNALKLNIVLNKNVFILTSKLCTRTQTRQLLPVHLLHLHRKYQTLQLKKSQTGMSAVRTWEAACGWGSVLTLTHPSLFAPLYLPTTSWGTLCYFISSVMWWSGIGGRRQGWGMMKGPGWGGCDGARTTLGFDY